MMNNIGGRAIAVGIVIIALLVLTFKSFYIVRPDQFVIVTKFGDPIEEVREPGLHFLIPFVHDPRYLDSRVRGWDDVGINVTTKELTPVNVTAFARWRISPDEGGPTRYYKAVQIERRAHAAMDAIVTELIQSAIQNNKLESIVRDKGRGFSAGQARDLDTLFDRFPVCRTDEKIKTLILEHETRQKAKRSGSKAVAQRSQIVQSILTKANSKLKGEFGIEILDLHFKYLNYAPQIHDEIIGRITKERKDDIADYNRVGERCLGLIHGEREITRGEIEADRDLKVRTLDGEAVATAIVIKNTAFGRDPGFFKFLKTLELFEYSFSHGTRLIISTDNPLLQLIENKSLLKPLKARERPLKPAAADKPAKPAAADKPAKPAAADKPAKPAAADKPAKPAAADKPAQPAAADKPAKPAAADKPGPTAPTKPDPVKPVVVD
jgi:membrane protease subunit HflC